MLNFHNPAVITQDSRAYNFAVMTFRVRGSCLSWTSGYLQTMAYRERYLYVSSSGPTHPGPLVLRVSYGPYVTQSLLLAGKSSLLLNMNGASFGDLAPTVARYGYVSIYTLLWLPLLHWSLGRTDLLVG
jgi:hypothetical protein